MTIHSDSESSSVQRDLCDPGSCGALRSKCLRSTSAISNFTHGKDRVIVLPAILEPTRAFALRLAAVHQAERTSDAQDETRLHRRLVL